MILSRRVSLDDAELDEVDGRILIQAIETGAGKDQITTGNLGGIDGGRVTAQHRDSVDIIVKFTINEKSYRPAERAAVLEAVCTWAAAGGWLKVNYKEDRRIRVIAAQLPGEGDARDRGNTYAITFRAYGVPYWQDETPQGFEAKGVSSFNNKQLKNAGNRDSVLDFRFKNTSGSTVNTLSVSCGGDQISMTGLGLANGETLELDHDDNGKRCLQRIRICSTAGVWRSVMDKRSGADEIRIRPGTNLISMSAGGSGRFYASAGARFA